MLPLQIIISFILKVLNIEYKGNDELFVLYKAFPLNLSFSLDGKKTISLGGSEVIVK